MDTTASNEPSASLKGQLKRRSLMASVAALAGAGLAKLLGPGRVEAGHDGTNVFHLGGVDNFSPAYLAMNAGNLPAFRASNNGGGTATGVQAFGSYWGVYGATDTIDSTLPGAAVAGYSLGRVGVVGRSGLDTGVYGIALETGPNLVAAGVTGTSGSRIGVLGTSTRESGMVGIATGAGPGLGPHAGVVGSSTDQFGVFGTSGSNVGMHGLSNTSWGVLGRSGEGGPTPPIAGVAGFCSAQVGVAGTSSTSHGVFGQTIAPAGTVVNGMLAAGLTGRTSSTIALYGYADGPPNGNYAPVGGVGQCQNGFGVWGLSSAGAGTTSRPGGGSPTAISGVLGTSTGGVGVYAISTGSYALAADGNGPSTVGALIRGLGGAQAAVFVGNVQIQGHLTVTGGVNGPVSAAPADSRGTTAGIPSLQAVQSPEALVEGIGEGRLVGGQAEVRFDAALAALLPDEQYHVVLTEYDDHSGLYVTGRTRQGFTVRAKDSPTASSAFSYRVVARSRTPRAAADAAALHVPTIPVPQGVPTLPVGREMPLSTSTLVPAPAPVPALPLREPRPLSPR
jgi:hypothetical protein